ncbi:MAG: endo-1,4-beta-xylanase [Clostridia bacterium]|nr:endo-1,4-beta-xylanase [Clostridia bacterium]
MIDKKIDKKALLKNFEEQNDFVEKRVSEGIEKYRKGNADIIVKDKDGKVVKNAKIKAIQKTHEFNYGANLFMLEEFENKEKNELYKKYFAECFNMATLPFYWSDLEPTEGKPRFEKDSEKVYRRPSPDLCLEFCKKHNIEPREHCLVYDQYTPSWLIDEPLEKIKEKLEERMKILAERYKNDIPCWEVINEVLFTGFGGNKRSVFYKEPDLVEWSFKTAEKYFKDNEITINDAVSNVWAGGVVNYNRSPYYMIIERALNNGARIDAIGMQFHMFIKKERVEELAKDMYNPQHLYKVLDLYSEFDKPLQITEVTIPAYSNDAEDEALQAELIEKLYSIWFSCEKVEQIIYWNLVDGYAAFAPQGDMTAGENYYYGGLIRFDLTPKPAYFTIKNLFEKKWHTEENIETNENGESTFRGFYGKYDLEIEVNGEKIVKEIDLSKKAENKFEIMI